MAHRRPRHRRVLVLRPARSARQALLRGTCRRGVPANVEPPRPESGELPVSIRLSKARPMRRAFLWMRPQQRAGSAFQPCRFAGYTPAMTDPANPPDLRPDLAPKPRFSEPKREGQPTIGMVSLGCPKALVDSERILTRSARRGIRDQPGLLRRGRCCGEHLRVSGLCQSRKS